jgi:hypothetical protein
MIPRRRAPAGLIAAALATGALGLLYVVLTRSTIHVPKGALESASARPATLENPRCGVMRTRYLHARDGLNRCTSDDACRAEARGGFFTELDGCARFLPGPAPRGELDTLARQWLDAGCAHDFMECEADPRSRCDEGRCVELPPPGIPERWRREMVLGYFSFFLPPDLQGSMGRGDDSYTGQFRRPGLTVDFDLGEWASKLDLDAPPVFGDHVITRMTSINGVPAKLVTARVLRRTGGEDRAGYMSGVYFAWVPLRPPASDWGKSLNLIAWCDEPAGCSEAAMIFESLVFY